MKAKYLTLFLMGTLSWVALTLVACGSSTTTNSIPFTISGTVTGLSGTLVLQNNTVNNLSLTANGAFTFTRAITPGGTYSINVYTQPTNQTCIVTNGSGTANANVTNVTVTCSTKSDVYLSAELTEGLVDLEAQVLLMMNDYQNEVVSGSMSATATCAAPQTLTDGNIEILCSCYGSLGVPTSDGNVPTDVANTEQFIFTSSGYQVQFSFNSCLLPDGVQLGVGGDTEGVFATPPTTQGIVMTNFPITVTLTLISGGDSFTTPSGQNASLILGAGNNPSPNGSNDGTNYLEFLYGDPTQMPFVTFTVDSGSMTLVLTPTARTTNSAGTNELDLGLTSTYGIAASTGTGTSTGQVFNSSNTTITGFTDGKTGTCNFPATTPPGFVAKSAMLSSYLALCTAQ